MTRKEAIRKLARLIFIVSDEDIIFTPEESAQLMDLIEREEGGLGMYPPMDNKGNFKWEKEKEEVKNGI